MAVRPVWLVIVVTVRTSARYALNVGYDPLVQSHTEGNARMPRSSSLPRNPPMVGGFFFFLLVLRPAQTRLLMYGVLKCSQRFRLRTQAIDELPLERLPTYK